MPSVRVLHICCSPHHTLSLQSQASSFPHTLPVVLWGLADKLQCYAVGAWRGAVTQLGSSEKKKKTSSRENRRSCCSTKPADTAECPPLYGPRRGTKDTKAETAGTSAQRAEANGLLVATQPSAGWNWSSWGPASPAPGFLGIGRSRSLYQRLVPVTRCVTSD